VSFFVGGGGGGVFEIERKKKNTKINPNLKKNK